MKNPALNNAGLQSRLKFFGFAYSNLPELFSRLFYVAASRLNSPRFSFEVIRPVAQSCQDALPGRLALLDTGYPFWLNAVTQSQELSR